MPKRERPDLNKDWPEQTRPHYKKLFDLQERLRARLKLAQELAVHNLVVKYPSTSPRKTNPIPIPGKQPENHLKKYQDEEMPSIRYYLSRMQGEIEQIKRAFTSGKRPNWYKRIMKVEDLTVEIWEAMDDIQVHLLLTLRGDSRAIKESNEVIIGVNKVVIEMASKIRDELLSLRPSQTKIRLDDYGIYDTVDDLAPQPEPEPEPEPEERPYIDFSTIPTWQPDQHRKKRG